MSGARLPSRLRGAWRLGGLVLGMALALPAGAAPAASAAPGPALGGLQVLLGLLAVLGVMMGAAWLLKRFAPANRLGGAPVRVVGGVNVGGRERVMVVEVADQWIVVGVAPGRVQALSTLPRQEDPAAALRAPERPPSQDAARSFSGWLKHSLDRRHGR